MDGRRFTVAVREGRKLVIREVDPPADVTRTESAEKIAAYLRARAEAGEGGYAFLDPDLRYLNQNPDLG